MKRILVIIPYFGKWPQWLGHYLRSCETNPTIDWLLISNCPPPKKYPANVRFQTMTMREYCGVISQRLDIPFICADSYKMCDIRPALGVIHQDQLAGYDYFGYGDLDVIYGDLRKFYTPSVLEYLSVSSHENMISGHLALIQNTEEGINAFRLVKNWQLTMGHPWHHAFDEGHFSNLFLTGCLKGRAYMREQYSTILSRRPWIDGTMDHPQVWYWRQGILTNQKDGDREFPYLHFMNWKSSRYLPPPFKKPAAWEKLKKVPFVSLDKSRDGWMMTRKGFLPLKDL